MRLGADARAPPAVAGRSPLPPRALQLRAGPDQSAPPPPHAPQAGADAAFKAVKAAYETLADPDARAAYDAAHSLRRLNFFRDVDEAGAPPGERRRGGWGAPTDPFADPFEVHRRAWAEGEPQPASTSGRDGQAGGGDDDGFEGAGAWSLAAGSRHARALPVCVLTPRRRPPPLQTPRSCSSGSRVS